MTPSGGMSIARPGSPEYRTFRGGGGGTPVSAPKPTYKNVRIEGNTVFINGQGFSVRPSGQEEFIRQQTGGGGSSAQLAIKQAQEKYKKLQEQQKLVAEKLAATRTQQALRDKQLVEETRNVGEDRLKKLREQAEAEQRRIRQESVDILREGGREKVEELNTE